MSKFEELMDNKEFIAELDTAESFAEVKEAFKENGVDLDEELALNIQDEELSASDLDEVAGGLSTKELTRILKRAVAIATDKKFGVPVGIFKFSACCGVLLRAYYDLNRYGNATRSYSESEILRAAKYMGCE